MMKNLKTSLYLASALILLPNPQSLRAESRWEEYLKITVACAPKVASKLWEKREIALWFFGCLGAKSWWNGRQKTEAKPATSPLDQQTQRDIAKAVLLNGKFETLANKVQDHDQALQNINDNLANQKPKEGTAVEGTADFTQTIEAFRKLSAEVGSNVITINQNSTDIASLLQGLNEVKSQLKGLAQLSELLEASEFHKETIKSLYYKTKAKHRPILTRDATKYFNIQTAVQQSSLDKQVTVDNNGQVFTDND